MQIASRACYFVYWIIDNLSVVAKIKILSADWKWLHVWSLKVRVFALLIAIVGIFYQVTHIEMDREHRNSVLLWGVRDCLELMPTGKDSKLFWLVDERAAGVGGLLSSLISTYLIWRE